MSLTSIPSRPLRGVICALALGGFACGDDGFQSPFESNSTTSGGTAAGTAGGATGASSAGGASAGDTSSGASSSGGTGPKFDVGGGGGFNCTCEVEFIWISNSEEGTVSKIRTDTLEEVGRYLTTADGKGNPSRTSVSLAGDVAVANRHGGLVKFYGDTAKCVDKNNNGMIDTSTGKGDVLPWDQEECRAWFLDTPATNQRPVAWAQGTVTPGTCNSTDEKVWTVVSAVPSPFPGLGGAGGVIVYLVDGDTGVLEKQIPIETFPGTQLGAYGGAVDSQGDLYFTSMGFGGGKLAKVYLDNFAYQIWDIPASIGPYGITVDHEDRVWLSSIAIGQTGAGRFDPATETWDLIGGFSGGSGLAEGPDGNMWISAADGIYPVDVDSLTVGAPFLYMYTFKGVAFDSEGSLFGCTYATEDDNGNLQGEDSLLKIDPATLTILDIYEGLDRPYTYSDMTGFALGNVTCPPEG